MAVVEVGLAGKFVRRPASTAAEDAATAPFLLTAANHYCTPELAPEAGYRWYTRRRIEIVEREVRARGGRVAPADALQILAKVQQGRITLWSEVFDLASRTVHFVPGPPDRNPSYAFKLSDGGHEGPSRAALLPVNLLPG